MANLSLCGFAGRDKADFCRCRIRLRPEVNDGKHCAVACPANREPALLDFAVLHIGNREEPRVVEDRGGKLEGHAVLTHVRGCLDLVPLELKLPVIQNRFSRTMLQQVENRSRPRIAPSRHLKCNRSRKPVQELVSPLQALAFLGNIDLDVVEVLFRLGRDA